ncbi:MAG: arylsulfatase [Planctomycetota bacterium]|nr:MAG: arylsulfatase [Planctomycetota bacterium]
MNLKNDTPAGIPALVRVVWVLWALVISGDAVRAEASRPNVLIFLADDLGYSDLGCYGSEIETPHLDALAQGGLRMSQFSNTARCWPSRGTLLTGYYAQQIRRDSLRGIKKGGSQGTRPAWAPLLPVALRPYGYRSYHSGKWHIDGQPLQMGFHGSYLLQDCGRNFHPKVSFLNDQKLPPVPPGTGYYSTTAIADYAIDQLKQHANDHADQPFFSYVAFVVPHFPLQAPAQDIAKYKGRYDAGWDVIQAKRWEKMQALGLIRGERSSREPDIGPPYDFPKDIALYGPGEVNRPIPWNDLNADQRAFQATKMEIHAAMIDRMDQEIGRVLAQVHAMGQSDNTLVMFLSDNGASAEMMVRDDGHDPDAPPGSAATHLCLGPGWSAVANTPFRRHKTWVHEGGTATPLVVQWPRGIAARGEIRHQPGHLVDVWPTILSLAGDRADTHDPVSPARPGLSMVDLFQKEISAPRELWWAHEGNRAIRLGDWKLVAAKEQPWELFNLRNDRAETSNLATHDPQRVADMAARWQAQADQYSKDAASE